MTHDGHDPVVWVDGALRPESAARISPFDHGFTTGDGVFETLPAVGGVLVGWTRHDRRLRVSAGLLGLDVPPTDVLRRATDDVLAANDLHDARIRITVTGGPGPLGSDRGGAGPTVVVAATEPSPVAPTIDVAVAPWPRNERGALAGLKTTSYAENVRALAWAKEQGAGEAIFANSRGDLCEGTATNVFLTIDGVLHTPPLESGCLAGVTRALIVELAAPRAGFEVDESPLPIDALERADEAFLTSSPRGAQPIARVDGVPLPAAPGPVTEKVAAAYEHLIAENPDP